MNTNITITRDKVLIPSAKVEIVIPEDTTEADIADAAVDLNRAQRNAFRAVIDCPSCEQYQADDSGDEYEDDKPVFATVCDFLTDQLKRLDAVSADLMASHTGVYPDHTINNLHAVADAMCRISAELREW